MNDITDSTWNDSHFGDYKKIHLGPLEMEMVVKEEENSWRFNDQERNGLCK